MVENFLWALGGRCPNCGKGPLYERFLKARPTCPACHVRFERWAGSWTISAVMGYTSGALFAVALGFYYLKKGELAGSESVIIPASIVFAALAYPVCKNIGFFLLWNNGFITVDPPSLVKDDPPPP